MCVLESQNEGIHSSGQQSERSEGCVPELKCVNVFKVCVCVCWFGGGALAISHPVISCDRSWRRELQTSDCGEEESGDTCHHS